METSSGVNLNPDRIRELASGFQISRIILTAVELNIFTILDKKMLPSSQVAKEAGVNERAVDRLMNALVALGFLRKVHGKFYNTEASSQFLVKGKTDFMGGLFHTNELWKSWGTLTKAVEKGTSVYGWDDAISTWTDNFIEAMHYRATKDAKILPMLIDLSKTKKMLDVGGGSGAFSMTFVEAYPGIHADIFDLPSVIPLTKKYVDGFQYKERISYIEGDYLENDFGTGYDLIFLSAIVHIQSYEENKHLLNKCSDALNIGGQIVIKDWVMNEDRTSPVGGAVFALNMLVGTDTGDTFTENEMREWFANAGIKKIERKDSSYGWSLMIGYKE